MSDRANDFDVWQAAWFARAEEQGHRLVRDEEGDIDKFAAAMSGHHNGPRCAACGWAVCMHCEHEIDAIPECDAQQKAPS